MSSIPVGIHQKVLDISTSLANAIEAEDEILAQIHYEKLLGLFNEQETSGNSHPFITEALADYTDDASSAVGYYTLALDQCRTHSVEPTHTKHISLAERLVELGEIDRAKTHLRQGRAEALQRNDTFWVNEADELLAKILK